MFENSLHNHTRIEIDPVTGSRRTVKATCAEINSLIGSHVVETTVLGSDGQPRMIGEVVTCADAEAELLQLRADKVRLETEVGSLEGDLTFRTSERDNYRRLLQGAMKVVFRMGPALQALLGTEIDDPELTADGSAVQVRNPIFVVIIDSQNETITIHDVDNRVQDASYRVPDGRISTIDQTNLIGHIDRIKRAKQSGQDPVGDPISLLDLEPSGV